MSLHTIIPIALLAIAFLMVFILASRHPWTTKITAGILIIIGITIATGSWTPAILWFVLLIIGLFICVGIDRIGDDD